MRREEPTRTVPHEPTVMYAHYTSTYCIHGLCDDCRLACKHCSAPCRCRCHQPKENHG